jgi:hypothetical protein
MRQLGFEERSKVRLFVLSVAFLHLLCREQSVSRQEAHSKD